MVHKSHVKQRLMSELLEKWFTQITILYVMEPSYFSYEKCMILRRLARYLLQLSLRNKRVRCGRRMVRKGGRRRTGSGSGQTD